MEANGNCEEIKAEGVELMEFIRPQSEGEDEISAPYGEEGRERFDR